MSLHVSSVDAASALAVCSGMATRPMLLLASCRISVVLNKLPVRLAPRSDRVDSSPGSRPLCPEGGSPAVDLCPGSRLLGPADGSAADRCCCCCCRPSTSATMERWRLSPEACSMMVERELKVDMLAGPVLGMVMAVCAGAALLGAVVVSCSAKATVLWAEAGAACVKRQATMQPS